MPTQLAIPGCTAAAASPARASGNGVPRVSGLAQWVANTLGRIAPDGYSWMQAVHWFHDYAPYASDRSHGPRRLNRTTLRIAQVLARLKECRPGVDTLASWLQISERTVQYHLGILRETGLLCYLSKGTRISGVGGRASEFARTIPPAFDEALGLRTGPSERWIRAVHGICAATRPLMARLAKKARRSLGRMRTKRVRRPAAQTTSAPSPCTPMGVGSSASSSAGTTCHPSESKLASGQGSSSAPKKAPAGRRQRTLNAVGRRHRLARELTEQIPWLARASRQRVAWVIRQVADAGWTAAEVIAVLGQEAPARCIHRPTGFLANRLRGAHELYDTPGKRARIVAWWRDSRYAEQARHAEWEGDWQAPTSRAVARQVDAALAHLHQHTANSGPEQEALTAGEDGLVDLEQLSRDDVIDLRAAAEKDPALIRTTLAACGEAYARRLFTNRLVDQVQRLSSVGRLTLHGWR